MRIAAPVATSFKRAPAKRTIREMLHDMRPIAGGAPPENLDELTPEALQAMSDEELAQATTNLVTEFDENAESDTPDIERARALADAVEAVRAESQRRETAAAEAASQLEELRGRVHVPEATAEEESEENETSGSGDSENEENETTTEVTTTTETTTTPQSVAASGTAPASRPSIAEIARQRPAAAAPRDVEPQRAVVTITAAADVPGHSAGTELEPRQVGEAFASKVDALMGSKGGAFPVARVTADYPEERVLLAAGTPGSDQNDERVQSVLRELERQMVDISPEALVAAGGLCPPLDARYDIANISTAARPVRDSLVRFQADRGGIRFNAPPTLADVAGGIGIWTAANDADPGTDGPATKPCVTITCGAAVEAIVDAVTMCIQVGNFSRRTFPEQFDAWYQLALAAHARVAEGRLLDKFAAGSTAVGDEAVVLGAARDILDTYARLAEAYRNRHRMDEDAVLNLYLPRWVRTAMILDLYKQTPGDDAFGQAGVLVDRAFAELRLNITWYIDSETAGAGEVSQIWPAQGAGAALGWKGEAIGYLFHPGAWLFLDAGTLDLGIDIRDSALISTNDVKAFMETFETAAKTGISSLKVTNAICVAGRSTAGVALDCA